MKLLRTAKLMIGVAAVSASFYGYAQSGASAPVSASAPAMASAANGGKTSSKAADRALRRKILTALADAKGMRAAGITVRATDGDVLLEGWVPEVAQIEQATRVAQGVPGVKTVRNTLTLSTF
ncbi:MULTISPECIES: BON domain-containing protein [Caballeronia]|jgi:osmotically-inducible protein OsmY|uniref:BON domain-containing protein n=1 Tax=Caballeronia TaxID=1827195 RepID=UPI001EF4E814|nr:MULTISPECIES: BON domain-containing protein [Caballeronia]MCG7401661.1 BON domain-containing protein [Caballeronia zhejiangensis]